MLPFSSTDLETKVERLFRLYPRGVTRKDVERHYGDAAEIVAGEAVGGGLWKWITRPDRRRCPGYFVRPDWAQPSWDLTKRQQCSLAWMLSKADANLQVRVSLRAINEASGGNLKSSVIQFVESLALRGYLVILERGRGKKATLFQLYPEGNSPHRHVAAERMAR